MRIGLELKKPLRIIEILLVSLVVNPLIVSFYPTAQRYFGYLIMTVYILCSSQAVVTLWKLFQQKLVVIAATFVLWVAWAVLIPIVQGTFEFSFIKNYWYGAIGILQILTVAVYILNHSSRENALDDFCKIYCSAMALYVVGTLVICIVPGLREFVVRWLVISDHERELLGYSEYVTRIGWSGISVYGSALKCSLAFAMAIYLFDKIKKPTREKYTMGVIIAALVLGNLLYARTGIIACFLVCAIYILKRLKSQSIKTLRIPALFLGAAVFILVIVLYIFRHNSMMRWMFEGVYSIFDGNGVAGSLRMMLEKMLFIPELKTFLVGDGLYTYEGAYYMHTDLGFMRLLLFGGVFFVAYVYCWVAQVFMSIFKNSRKTLLLCTNLACVLLIFEIKGEALVHVIPVIVILLILASVPCVNNEYKKFYVHFRDPLLKKMQKWLRKDGRNED